MKRSRIAIVAVVAIGVIAILGWYYYSTKPVEVAGSIILRDPTLPNVTKMTWALGGIYGEPNPASLFDAHGNVCSFHISLPPGEYEVDILFGARGYTQTIIVPKVFTYTINFTCPPWIEP